MTGQEAKDNKKFRSTGPYAAGGRPRAIIAAAVLVGLVVGGCGKKPVPKEAPPVNVTVEVVSPIALLEDTFVLHAKVEPNRVVELAAEVAGRIEEILCREGDRVSNGGREHPVIKLKTDLLRAQFDRAKAVADFDRLEYDKIRELHARGGAAARNELDRAASKAATSKAALDEARGLLERANIYPPIDGVLDTLEVEVGEYVQPGQVVARIVDADTVKVVADVPERDVQFLRKGSETTILYDFRGRRRERRAEITYIGKVAHARTLTTRVEIATDNRGGKFFSGQLVRVRMLRRKLSNVIMAPMDAVIPWGYEKGKTSYVAYIVNDGKAARREVEMDIKLIRGNRVRIVKGLAPGDRLIVKGHRYVGPGQEVRVIAPAATSRPSTRPSRRPVMAEPTTNNDK